MPAQLAFALHGLEHLHQVAAQLQRLARHFPAPRKCVDALDDASGLVGQFGHAVHHRFHFIQTNASAFESVEQAVGKATQCT